MPAHAPPLSSSAPSIEVVVVAPPPAPSAPSSEEVYMSFLDKLVKLNGIMGCVAPLSICLLSIPLNVFSGKPMTLAIFSLFFFVLSSFLFHGLKIGLLDKKNQINSRDFRIQMRLGYFTSFCGLCFIVFALLNLFFTAAAPAPA